MTDTIPQTVAESVHANIFVQLNTYAEQMALARPISNEDGAKNQYLLWVTIKSMLSLKGADFTRTYSEFLRWLSQQREEKNSAFNERALYRTFENSRLRGEELKRMQRFLNLAIATANPKTRQIGLKQVNLRSTFTNWSEEILVKMDEFYTSV